jgi:signal transduction histidine kinase
LIAQDITGTDLEEDPELAGGGFKSFLANPVRLRGKTVGCLGMFNREKGGFAQEEMNFLGMLAQALTIEEERLAHEESIRHFVDIASHELRTPLSIIKGYADAFQFGDLMDLNDFQLDKIRIINTKADKMTKTINDLLDLSRIERGHFTIDKQMVDLATLIKSAVRQMREKGSSNRFSIGSLEDLREVSADPEKIVDLLLILLDNAVHYSPPASEISVELEPRQNEVVISVMDRGWGIPEKDHQTIFERFYQVEDLRHHSATGIGLGLYIAREIVEGHGGNIWYEARDGGGSIFRFSLPE